MKSNVKFWLIFFTLTVVKVKCNVIEAVNNKVDVTSNSDGTAYTVSMDENNHDYTEKTPLFIITGASTEPTISFIQTSFRYIIEKDATVATSFIFYANQSFDYETQERTYSFNVFVNGMVPLVNFNIRNIDDEAPSLEPPQCEFEENTIFTAQNSTCSCKVSDPDGWLNLMNFKIISIAGGDATKIFSMDYREPPAEQGVYEADVYILVNEELDYQSVTFYLFDIEATDGAGHATTPNKDVRGIVNVIDLPDTPPEWKNFFTTAQFEEQSEQTFVVEAIDGDYGLNYEINYVITYQDLPDDNYVEIDNNGTITVHPIDRDKDDLTTFSFTIMAYEVPNAPIWNNTLDITFYIIDIDNNPPLIKSLTDQETDVTVDFDDTNDKVLNITFLENYAGGLNQTIFIQDIDTGENAQFTVELEELEERDADYTEAFLIVPTAGYRRGDFQITVRNATWLDYEVPEWVNIKFNVFTKGLDASKNDRMLVNITLIDYNDELPIFEEPEYSIDIKETAKKGDFIINVHATDRDAEDAQLAYSLIGSTYTNRVLEIEPSGDVMVADDNAFDYDTVNPIFVQVRATDKADHRTTVPLTINLLDVNNKAPTISPGAPINVDENQKSGFRLETSISASDMDTTADLSAEIDWESSYVMKNSRRLDMNNQTIADEVKFLKVVYERVNSDDDTNRDINIYLEVLSYDDVVPSRPDYELFDSLYLSIKVTDWNTDEEFMYNQNTSALILISINDINDNAPFFPEDLPGAQKENRTVQEAAPVGTSVGSIVAIDYDVGDTVTYDCKALDDKFDWLEVNTDTGAFTVISPSIDADTYKTFYFNYSCTASDDDYTHTSDPMIVHFYIIDTNNQVPTVTIDDTVYVDEKSSASTKVVEVDTNDEDRDIPFHTVECTLDRDTTCADKFIIQDNIVLVRNGGNDIDRDLGDETYSCPMTCTDNPDRLQNDRNPHSVPRTFTIVLNDINDHTPEVLTTEITTSESAAEGDIVGTILAMDIDKDDNAEIDFNVEKVVDSNDNVVEGIFVTTVDDDYRVNLTVKQANLVASRDLKGLYGTYTVTIGVADRGKPPNSDSYEITVTIEKFNFESPRFIFPSTDDMTFLLLSFQTPGSPLILFNNKESEYLDDFIASDNSEHDKCNKWDITIDVEQTSPQPTDDVPTIFVISPTDPCQAQLQINNRFDSNAVLGQTYHLKLTAIAREGTPQEGESSYTTETSIRISFMNNDQKPTFSCEGNEMTFEFREEKLDQSKDLQCEAKYPVEDDSLSIFYLLDVESADDIVKDTFIIDERTGKISLKQVISYKHNRELQFKIVASNDTTPWSYNPDSYLNVICNVIEINNNVPQFTKPSFFGAIMTGYNGNTVVVTVEATDLDTIDQGHLEYNIEGTISNSGSGLNNLPSEPFIISKNTGDVRLNFQVDSSMSGYFQFKVKVSDQEDQFGNGPHYNTTDVTIFIITSDNTVAFRFYNGLDEVQRKEDDMLTVISEILEYNAYKQNIDEDHSTTEEMTIASLYFVNDTNVQVIPANTILRSVSNIDVYSRLVSELRNRTGLILMSFPSNSNNSENLEEVLKAWLVGVSVVLGALCLILLVTFVLKTRQLNNRIKNLTTNKFGSQESGLNRLGMAAPTTNKHAIEGSNPIFNVNGDEMKRDLSKFDDFDNQSIRSGDSDLIGIEDNPEFDYNGRSQHI